MELKGKSINFLGDSITEGYGISIEDRYDNVMKRKCDLAGVYNYGISGTRIAHQRNASKEPRYDLCFCGRAFDLNPDADIFVVYGGVNDYIHGDAPIGTPEDLTPATFSGGVNFLMNLLKTRYPGKTIVFMTPAHMNTNSEMDTEPSHQPEKGADAKPLAHYVEVIKAAGVKHGIPVLDLFKNLEIDPKIPADRETYTVDGLHFNSAGHRALADCLIAFLRNL